MPSASRLFFRHALLASALGASCALAQPSPAASAASTTTGGVRSVIVGRQPAPSFLESIAVGPDDAIYVTDFHGRQILRHVDGQGLEPYLRLDVHPWGLAFDADGDMYFGAGEADIVDARAPKVDLLYRLAKGEKKAPVRRLKVDGAVALNGMTALAPGRLLVADGRGGVIWLYDTRANTVSKFVQDELLDAPAGFKPSTPAANGVKLHGGWLYVSNTARQTIVRVRISPDTLRPVGRMEVFADKVRADDFAFSPAGNLVHATHRDKVMKIDPAGNSSEVPGTGPELAGNTAVVWRRNGDGPYVATDGGFILHHWYGGPAPTASNLVRLDGVD